MDPLSTNTYRMMYNQKNNDFFNFRDITYISKNLFMNFLSRYILREKTIKIDPGLFDNFFFFNF